MRVPVQQYLANSAHFGLTEPWLSIPAAQLACLLVLRPCALAALHITAPFVPLTLDLVQFEDVQHLTQLKWDLQVGKDYYTGENGPEEKRAIDVCRCIAEIQRRPQLSDISLLQCAQHTRRKPSWPHTEGGHGSSLQKRWKTSNETVEGSSLFLFAVATRPATEKSLSTGALVAGMARYCLGTVGPIEPD